jgi:hyaluronoglucosaminidase
MAAGGRSVGSGRDRRWGYIEGYYGRLLDWTERAGLLAHLAAGGGNAYLYAPKEDPLHRRDWRVPYDHRWRRSFARFAAQGRAVGVDVIPGMAPGLSFDYLDEKDYAALLGKLAAFRDMGCRVLALLMDDIPPRLPAHCRGRFASLGEAHGRLLGRLQLDLNRGGRKCRLWFCPTVYTDQFATGPVARDPYLTDLAALIPRDIPLLWTGPGIISERLTAGNLRAVSRLFRGNLLLWDNLYANDYCPQKLFVGPYRGRSPELQSLTRGILLNPTGLPATDRFLLDLLAAFYRGEPAARGWKDAVEAHGIPAAFLRVAKFLATPFFRPSAGDLAPASAAAFRKALHPLIWDWKGPLHLEWYPYLFMLDADLKACGKGKERPDAAWVRKRYPPILAKLLLGQG